MNLRAPSNSDVLSFPKVRDVHCSLAILLASHNPTGYKHRRKDAGKRRISRECRQFSGDTWLCSAAPGDRRLSGPQTSSPRTRQLPGRASSSSFVSKLGCHRDLDGRGSRRGPCCAVHARRCLIPVSSVQPHTFSEPHHRRARLLARDAGGTGRVAHNEARGRPARLRALQQQAGAHSFGIVPNVRPCDVATLITLLR